MVAWSALALLAGWIAGAARPPVEPPVGEAPPPVVTGTGPAADETPAARQEPPVEAPAATDATELALLIPLWAEAWSGQRIDEYLSYYSERFRPADGGSREAWEAGRRRRLAAPRFIRVDISDFAIESLEPGRAAVRFRQGYESDSYSDRAVKRLDLEREQGRWKIISESVIEPAGGA